MAVTNQFVQQYKNSTPAQKSYLSMALTLGLIIGLIVITYPALQHILKLQKEINDGRKTLTQLQQKSQALSDASISYEAIKPDLPLLDQALPAGTDLKAYLQKPVESLARDNKLGMEGLQFNEVPLSLPDTDTLLKAKTIPYSLTLNGNFTDFSKFLASLEKFIRVTEVNEIVVSSEKSGKVSAELKINTHYFGSDTPGEKTSRSSGANQ